MNTANFGALTNTPYQLRINHLVIQRRILDRSAEFVRLRRSLRGLGAPIDLILVSEDEVDQWRDVPGTLIHHVIHEGRTLVAGDAA